MDEKQELIITDYKRALVVSKEYKNIVINDFNPDSPMYNFNRLELTFDELEKLYHETKHYLNQQDSAILNDE